MRSERTKEKFETPNFVFFTKPNNTIWNGIWLRSNMYIAEMIIEIVATAGPLESRPQGTFVNGLDYTRTTITRVSLRSYKVYHALT